MIEMKNGHASEIIESQVQDEKSDKDQAADFETAIAATGYGKFNLLLLAAILPSACSQVYEIESTGYVIPVAQCDLGLTLEMKGIINSVSLIGMITSGFFWGYFIDVFGRRRTMIYGYFVDGVCFVVAGMSQNLTMLIVAKFFGGFVINGPFSAAASLLSEYHSSEYRARVQLVRGIWVTMGSLSIALIAYTILPWDFKWTIFGVINLHSWNLFFMVCSLSPFVATILFYLLPESPKFLMSAGRNPEALKVLQKVYSMNTGKPENTYPIVHLKNELEDSGFSIDPKNRKSSFYVAVQRGLYNVKPLFKKPHVYKLILTCSNVFMILLGANTLRFWIPQLLSTANDYQQSHNGSSSNTCEMIDSLASKSGSSSSDMECSVNFDNTSVYLNAAIIGSSQIISFVIISVLVNFIGKKTIAIVIAVIAGIAGLCIYVSPNLTVLITIFAAFISASALCGNLNMTITLEIFPTTFRASALSLYLMSGRLGSVTGNSIFPYLLKSGCLPPFLFLGCVMLAASTLTIFYPNTENKSLE